MGAVRYVGVVQRDDGAVLVDGAGQVPGFDVPTAEAGFWQDVAVPNRRFSAQLECEVTVLRHLAVERVGDGSVRILLLEPHGSPEGRFVDIGSADWQVPPSAIPTPQRTIGVPEEHRVPWFEPGWYDEAASWIRAADPAVTVGGITQVRSWNLSTVLLADTDAGRRFFKAESPALPGEVRLTIGLASHFPEVLPRVVTGDVSRRWMLLCDAGAERLDEFDDPTVWARAGRQMAQMQVDSLGLDVLGVGCPSRPAGDLADDVEAMATDEAWLTVGEYGLARAELEAVRTRARSWMLQLQELDSLGVPLTIEHGDFHPGQVMVDEVGGGPRVLDWSDASISVPFISLEVFLATVKDFLRLPAAADPPAPARAFRDAYVETWGQVLDPPTVERARALIRAALPALQALPYWRLVRRMEQPWEMWNVLPYTMRDALDDQST